MDDFLVSDANTRLDAVEGDVETIEGDVAEQDERMTVLESSVDLWDDRIIALEVMNVEIMERLITLEEVILSKKNPSKVNFL